MQSCDSLLNHIILAQSKSEPGRPMREADGFILISGAPSPPGFSRHEEGTIWPRSYSGQFFNDSMHGEAASDFVLLWLQDELWQVVLSLV